MLITEPLPYIILRNQASAGVDDESSSPCALLVAERRSRTVRFAANEEVHFVETRSELLYYRLWCTQEDFDGYRETAKQSAMEMRKKHPEIIREMEVAYQEARDYAKQIHLGYTEHVDSLVAPHNDLLNRWTSLSSPGRGLERFCSSREAKENSNQEYLASRNVVLNLQHLLKNKEGSTEMIARNYHFFSKHAGILARMMAQADAEAVLTETCAVDSNAWQGKKQRSSTKTSSPKSTNPKRRTSPTAVIHHRVAAVGISI